MLIFWSIIISLFCVCLYFAPSFLAIGRKHSYALQITLLNALLGWSFFGWAAALIWATTNQVDKQVSTKLPWIIISIFLIAVLCPVLFFSSIFSFSGMNTESNGIKSSSYSSFYYKFPNVIKNTTKTHDEDNKNDDEN